MKNLFAPTGLNEISLAGFQRHFIISLEDWHWAQMANGIVLPICLVMYWIKHRFHAMCDLSKHDLLLLEKLLLTDKQNKDRRLGQGNALLISCAYAPFIRKINFKMLKKLEKIRTCIYLHILHGHAKFREKWIFFIPYAKKTKACITERPILVPNFIIFT
jgi:hypothetical protein